MSTYIGKLQIDSNDEILIGSTLYGVCATINTAPNKIVTLNNFDNKVNGITIYVKFINGNTALNNVTLTVGSTTATAVTGNCICEPNEIVAFTYEEVNASLSYWRAERGVKIDIENTIITKINGQEVNAASTAYVDNKIIKRTILEWAATPAYIAPENTIIVYTDATSYIENNETIFVPSIKISDGITPVVDLPFVNDDIRNSLLQHIENQNIHVTAEKQTFWNNKINCNDEVINNNLVLTRN